MSSFLAELRRRNVVRVAGLYLVAAWLIVQVAETVLPTFDTPAWVLRTLIVLLALGFIPAMVFSWVFEVTPEGLKREHQIDRNAAAIQHSARKLDIAVIVMLVAIGGLMLWQANRAPPAPVVAQASGAEAAATAAAAANADTPADGTTAAPAVADKSIAVLPFADFSPGGDQAWFADGLTDEILNSLARTPDLRVSARTSSFAYKGSPLPIPKIAAELGVAHILEGSVRSTTERIRVTAQLIRAADGFHLWSQTYDRPVTDMIAIQEDLATQIATAMQTSMDPEALKAMASAGTRSVEAYQAYLRGSTLAYSDEGGDFQKSYEQFEAARRLDPSFGAAHARAANYWLQQLDPTSTQSGLTRATTAEMEVAFRERIDAAIASAGNDVERTGWRALRAAHALRMREAIALYEPYVAQRPGDAEAALQTIQVSMYLNDLARVRRHLDAIWPQAATRVDMALTHINYAHRTGDTARAADEALQLVERWPTHPGLLYQAHRALLWDGRVEAARGVLERMEALATPTTPWSAIPPARQACAEGRRADVERALAETPADDVSQRWHLLMLLGRRDEAADELQRYERAGETYALAGFLTYRQFDPTPFPSLMKVLEREKVPPRTVVPIPFACPPAAAPATGGSR